MINSSKKIKHNKNRKLTKKIKHNKNRKLTKKIKHNKNKKLTKKIKHNKNKKLTKKIKHNKNRKLNKNQNKIYIQKGGSFNPAIIHITSHGGVCDNLKEENNDTMSSLEWTKKNIKSGYLKKNTYGFSVRTIRATRDGVCFWDDYIQQEEIRELLKKKLMYFKDNPNDNIINPSIKDDDLEELIKELDKLDTGVFSEENLLTMSRKDQNRDYGIITDQYPNPYIVGDDIINGYHFKDYKTYSTEPSDYNKKSKKEKVKDVQFKITLIYLNKDGKPEEKILCGGTTENPIPFNIKLSGIYDEIVKFQKTENLEPFSQVLTVDLSCTVYSEQSGMDLSDNMDFVKKINKFKRNRTNPCLEGEQPQRNWGSYLYDEQAKHISNQETQEIDNNSSQEIDNNPSQETQEIDNNPSQETQEIEEKDEEETQKKKQKI